ncbi:hypothetical protein BDK51DRAFT_29817 [Blyttiomyces helicus]|uniref:Uncharacterized protein n=1 Tax=Blyttiomyces helicus TaxID=388810 RepID=A0A4P9W8L8_9FUNG|nr:hypothetical protein BDK51DRAFT_29817 [Blyttiomyces helicus]|eukprot:RKO88704.1 hypothetical protein BDK51DRAFT_29817 [Blyttiomyces helicus]
MNRLEVPFLVRAIRLAGGGDMDSLEIQSILSGLLEMGLLRGLIASTSNLIGGRLYVVNSARQTEERVIRELTMNRAAERITVDESLWKRGGPGAPADLDGRRDGAALVFYCVAPTQPLASTLPALSSSACFLARLVLTENHAWDRIGGEEEEAWVGGVTTNRRSGVQILRCETGNGRKRETVDLVVVLDVLRSGMTSSK